MPVIIIRMTILLWMTIIKTNTINNDNTNDANNTTNMINHNKQNITIVLQMPSHLALIYCRPILEVCDLWPTTHHLLSHRNTVRSFTRSTTNLSLVSHGEFWQFMGQPQIIDLCPIPNCDHLWSQPPIIHLCPTMHSGNLWGDHQSVIDANQHIWSIYGVSHQSFIGVPWWILTIVGLTTNHWCL